MADRIIVPHLESLVDQTRVRLADHVTYMAPLFASSRSPLRRLMTTTLMHQFQWVLTPHQLRTVVEGVLRGALCPHAFAISGIPEDHVGFGLWGGVPATYFVRLEVPVARLRKPIKIGTSRSVGARLAGMQTSVPYPLTLLASMPDGLLDERLLHREFGARRMMGEWFRPGARLRRLIAEVETVTAPAIAAHAARARDVEALAGAA